MKGLSMEQVFGYIAAQILVVGNCPSGPAFPLPTILYLPHNRVCNTTKAIHTTTTAVIKTKLNQHL